MQRQSKRITGLTIEIHDDRPGIAKSERKAVFQRGARVDQHTPGQGIGLAVAREIIERYDGQLTTKTSELGGALVRARFPSKRTHQSDHPGTLET